MTLPRTAAAASISTCGAATLRSTVPGVASGASFGGCLGSCGSCSPYIMVSVALGVLKERARDVGDRRMRYGVKVPGEPAAGSSSGQGHGPLSAASTAMALAGLQLEGDVDDDDITRRHHRAAAMEDSGDDHRKRADQLQPRTLEEYFAEMLVEWIKQQAETEETSAQKKHSIPCISIVASGIQNTGDIASEVLPLATAHLKDIEVIWINLPALHSLRDLPLLARETLSYILRECEQKKNKKQQEEVEVAVVVDEGKLVSEAAGFKRNEYSEVRSKIRGINIRQQIKMIQKKIDQFQETERKTEEAKNKDEQIQFRKTTKIEPLEVFVEALRLTSSSSSNPDSPSVEEAAKMLEVFMNKHKPKICLDIIQYQDILQKLFPASSNELPQQEEAASTAAVGTVNRIKHIIHEIAPDIIQELRKVFPASSIEPRQQETSTTAAPGMDQIKHIIREIASDIIQELRKVFPPSSNEPRQQEVSSSTNALGVDQIEDIIRKIAPSIIRDLQKEADDHDLLYYQWELTRKALSLIGCANGSAVIVTTKNSIRAREFCYPREQEPMTCSLVGAYHQRVLRLTGHQKNENEEKAEHAKILRDILDKCDPDEFCMKIFAHALYANPRRTKDELIKLQGHLALISQRKSLGIAAKIFKFSYNDLHKDYKSCLLYLAIFPQGQKIKRSTIVGRWIAEGLITTMEDWPSAVHQGERCFDMLIARWLVYPGDVSATGEVKSCIVGEIVHEIITKIAKKQHIVDTRLSYHLARHFSIFSDLRLRRSDSINGFLEKLHKYALQLRLLKVLDLEDCKFFDRCLKDICNNILLLKYLSLRRTNITYLPHHINNLHDLEILDIRETKVHARCTKDVVLLKLKRLMAGCVPYPCPSNTSTTAIGDDGEPSFSSVQIPYKIKKMENMEVLSNVKASRTGFELKDIGKLWQLRKLGVVISNNPIHTRNLLEAISDLNECLESLSITLLGTRSEGGLCNNEDKWSVDMEKSLTQPPKHLNSLNISGTTKRKLISFLLTKGGNKLTKLTFSRTSLNQDSLKDIAKLSNLLCFRLQNKAYTDEQILFKESEFENLKFLIIEGTNMFSIRFEAKATPNLEKIVLSSTPIEYLDGVTNLPNFKELELNGNEWLQLACFDGASHLSKVTLKSTLLDLNEHKTLAMLPNLRSLMLLKESCIGTSLKFKEGEFAKLNLILVDCAGITSISFTNKAAPKLNKIIWSYTTKQIESLSGIGNLPELKEIELNGDLVPDQVKKDVKAHKNKHILTHRKPQKQPQENVSAPEEKLSPFPWFSKINKHRR
ncbi:hypothetical protein OsI_23146 [Oryza sativa Indica Group]|uniref:Uncharacterized protein n=1 Tax=Oryza sativa subsp. indica TaxID=39946 RepID=B8B330_ORYSI|nr:hypothetical protein OsI_23146 [Oryza sativa Indica Group]